MISLDDMLASCGYKLIDDAWNEDGRRTYHHNDEATRDFIISLGNDLRLNGWVPRPNILRAFLHPLTEEIIEIESGGADVSGHFLHHIKTSD